MKRTSRLNVRIEIQIRQELERLARIENRTVSTMGQWALKLGLLELNKIVRAKQDGELK